VVDFFIKDSDELDYGFVKIKVVHTAGHTEGSVCYSFADNLFTGDILLKNDIGRTDLPGGNIEKTKESIKKIVAAFTDATIYPGHFGNTTLGEEKKTNTKLITILNS